jgi:Flp pilus assembly protein TadB
MAIQKLEELTNEQLAKKDKDVTTLLIVLLIFYSAAIIILLVFKPLMALIVFPLLVTVLPLVLGRKKIKEELKKRMNKNQV